MILRRLALFFGFFAVLIAPWPGINDAYSAWIRASGRAAFYMGHPGFELKFEALQETRDRPLDTRIVLIGLRDPQGEGRRRATVMDLDMRGIGWVPTAFLAALVLASPIPWPRRVRALVLGLVAMHAFVLLSLGLHVLDHSQIGGGTFMDGLDETLINQVGPGFFVAMLLWVLVTVRPGDWATLTGRSHDARHAVADPRVTYL